jgi:hypothetical protein
MYAVYHAPRDRQEWIGLDSGLTAVEAVAEHEAFGLLRLLDPPHECRHL